MKRIKVCPAIVSNWPETSPGHSFRLSDWTPQDNYGSDYRNSRDYWYARRAFLSSYHFEDERNGLKEKLKRSVKGFNVAAAGVVSEIRREISRKRIVIRAFRFTLALPSFVFVSIRCFTPWVTKKELISYTD
ncbi:hypothetical protein M5689_022208 [Euphorbia peplus]|nr:hypothetical protein M5689_022208 [Euphorbia peplus]